MYEIFEELLKKKGVTPYRVAKETGVSTSTFSDWKTGRSTPKQDKLAKIADYFGVSLNYLLGRTDDPTPSGARSPIYDDEALELMEEMHKRPELKVLFSTTKNIKKEDIELIDQMIKRMTGYDDD